MDHFLKVLVIDAATGFYKVERYRLGDFFGPIDLGLHLAGRRNSLNIGAGLLAGSIFPGSNRLFISGFSMSWGSFYVSSMGGAGLVFDNLGLNMVCISGKAPTSSILYLNRIHGEEVQVELQPIELGPIWHGGRGGVYSLMDTTYELFGHRYETDPRILSVGPAAQVTDMGAIGSVPITKGKISHVDTWAGRGGFGSKMLQEHGIASVIYGGTVVDEDFRDRKVADQWFIDKYEQKLAAKDMEATTKYRFDPKFNTGGTFGVNYATMGGRIMAFNYKTIYMSEEERLKIHKDFILDHYLKQFNEETIEPKQQRNCGEPCVAVCKKMNNEFKKDYEPYQTMGPLCGVFDQRAAERLNRKADTAGFDAISVGGVLAWLMETLDEGVLTPEELGVDALPVFSPEGFRVVEDSNYNAEIGLQLIDSILEGRGILDLSEGARKFARRIARKKGKKVLDSFLYNANARKGWSVPNQYWTPGVLSPMPIAGKYYMVYGNDFIPPRELGRRNSERMIKELILDNAGFCRFHRTWAEEMIPEIIESLFGLKEAFLANVAMTAGRINSRNAAVFWESERNMDYIITFLKRKRDVDGSSDPELLRWIERFEENKQEASLEFWYEMHKGTHESLREFG
ncbi:MAG: aldehyde ferredoxin oxidoreductase [Spirochaetaceae bacterium]|nr:MAG: aldehyde ferredoxin oxidoreductase [Spirochaetaceae bacterium]